MDDSCLLGCSVVQAVVSLPTFQDGNNHPDDGGSIVTAHVQHSASNLRHTTL